MTAALRKYWAWLRAEMRHNHYRLPKRYRRKRAAWEADPYQDILPSEGDTTLETRVYHERFPTAAVVARDTLEAVAAHAWGDGIDVDVTVVKNPVTEGELRRHDTTDGPLDRTEGWFGFQQARWGTDEIAKDCNILLSRGNDASGGGKTAIAPCHEAVGALKEEYDNLRAPLYGDDSTAHRHLGTIVHEAVHCYGGHHPKGRHSERDSDGESVRVDGKVFATPTWYTYADRPPIYRLSAKLQRRGPSVA